MFLMTVNTLITHKRGKRRSWCSVGGSIWFFKIYCQSGC